MLKECIEVFEHELGQKGERLILDSYIPADGTYFVVDKEGKIKTTTDIKMDKKTRILDKSNPLFPEICFYDYQSQLISMNKPIDGKKVIHSNNYLSFFVKKDSITSGKLTEAVIDDYYEILKNPKEQKYKKSKEASRIYELFEETEGPVNVEAIEEKKEWIKTHIFSLENVDMGRKDYLKIFFEEDQDIYKKEGRRYFLPNIYNSNDYNVEIKGEVYGLPDNNAGMNAKKPFLSVKSRKIPAPYILNGDKVMLQKQFFDYLMNFAAAGCYHIYVDTESKKIAGYPNGQAPKEVESGYYLRIKKGKNEAEIQAQDNIPGYKKELTPPFKFTEIIQQEFRNHEEYRDSYHTCYDRLEVGKVINKVFFSNWLAGNYTMEPSDMTINDGKLKQNILFSREVIFSWVFKGIDHGMKETIERASLEAIKASLLSGYRERAQWQMNLRWSFKEYFAREGEDNMAEVISELMDSIEEKVLANKTIPVESDAEYYYAVGQLVAYLLSLSKAKDKNQALLNPFINAKTDRAIKERIMQIFKKYNYAIASSSKRAKNLMAMVEGYVPEGSVNHEKIMLGYMCDNAIYKKEEK